MRLSDLMTDSQSERPKLPHPASSLADPPITLEEAQQAQDAICPFHGSQYRYLNQEGRVYRCPIGGQLWRHSGKQGGMYAPLRIKF
ncbi:MAG TPA: hypothetical protein VN660_00990 [Steroidobacteraceae bacterium]|nr:hypothetical protein [Steroidobacteraceae bacterium]